MTDRAQQSIDAACVTLDGADPTDVAAAIRALVFAMLAVTARLDGVISAVDDINTTLNTGGIFS
jgi:hypothetical protein